MGALWAIPPAIVLLGACLACVLARQAGALLSDLRDELDRLGEVQAAVVRVRAETGRARSGLDELDRR